jgi:hypothetical protein
MLDDEREGTRRRERFFFGLSAESNVFCAEVLCEAFRSKATPSLEGSRAKVFELVASFPDEAEPTKKGISNGRTTAMLKLGARRLMDTD